MQANGNSKGMVSEINVTPLVDVMLVLLIIFMVTAPMMTQGVDVKLPESSAPAIPSDDERLVVTITQDRKIYINDNLVELGRTGIQARAPLLRTGKITREFFYEPTKQFHMGMSWRLWD